MQENKLLSISNFAIFSQTTRATLIFYDNIDLLKPAYRAKNGYRYYSANQLSVVNLIRTCQSVGIPLNDIKALVKYRTPPIMQEFLKEQIKLINDNIREQLKVQKLFTHLKQIIDTALAADANEIRIKTLPEEPIVLGDINDYSNGRNDYDALLSFYKSCRKKFPDMDMNYPVWGYFSERQISSGDCGWPERYYFHNPDGQDERPKALYAIGYGTGGYGANIELWKRLMTYINENGFEVCGPAYMEYPLNEISIMDAGRYLMRFMVTVKKISH